MIGIFATHRKSQISIREYIWKTIALLALAPLPFSALASNITVTYLADARPTEVLYIKLLQSNQTLTGSRVDVVPNGAVATKSDTLQLSGTILNDMMSIFTNANVICRKLGI